MFGAVKVWPTSNTLEPLPPGVQPPRVVRFGTPGRALVDPQPRLALEGEPGITAVNADYPGFDNIIARRKRLGGVLRTEQVVDQLRRQTDPDKIHALLTAEPTEHAA